MKCQDFLLKHLFISFFVSQIVGQEPRKGPSQGVEEDGSLEGLLRKPKKRGNPNDEDWFGSDNRKYMVKKGKGGNKSMFRTNSRGSKKKVTKTPELLKHDSNPDDPPGCGNPVCVVIDTKPMRFRSICQYLRVICDANRKEQMNFLQKGDCYDIIDNKEGATEKPWISESTDVDDCSSCKDNESCGNTITVNIDLSNILDGKSSAFGGQTYHEQTSQRMVGVPIEFENVCEMMKYFKSNENINVKTQVIGLAVGKKDELFPKNSNSQKCLWTEWFDHDTPCNNDGDKEVHSEHYQRLDESITGPMRICKPSEIVGKTQYAGGSEITQVSAYDAIDGNAVGADRTLFKQTLKVSNYNLECKDTEQDIGKLPPPFIFGEGMKGSSRKNATCLDYKARYCCKSNAMYRPEPISYFQSRLPPTIPIGPFIANVTVESNGLVRCQIRIFSIYGRSPPSIIDIIPAHSKSTGKVKSSISGSVITMSKKVEIQGSFEVKVYPNGNTVYTFVLKRDMNKHFAKIKITYDKDGRVVFASCEDDQGGIVTTEVVKSEEGNQMKTVVKTQHGDKMEMVTDNHGNKIRTQGQIKTRDEKLTLWKRVAKATQELCVEYFIESPPVALLFAECVWKDWVNLEYPNKHRTGGEWELRQQTEKFGAQGRKSRKRYYRQHVCGKVPEMALFVDAVTMETQKPWYELTYHNQQYETYKISPYHGYICNDQNMLDGSDHGRHCQDMKVRYCCVKKMRAQWSEWGSWSECTRSCGCGVTKRTKKCVQSKYRKKDSSLYNLAYNPKCVGQDTEERQKLFSEQMKSCNIEPCPVDFHWGSWSSWSGCTVSCGGGTKGRTRICSPASNGGAQCPDKRKHKDLYYEVKDCTMKDCETFFEGEWGDWSSCSKTCGEGTRRRDRCCFSAMTLQKVDNENCANEASHFAQSTKCKLQECPVDGSWGEWTAWGACTQNCIPFPDGDNQVITKARRERRRFCTNPLPAFGGAKCVKNDKFKWLSHENAELDTSACKSPLDSSGQEGSYDDGVTPWCPENCILTEWAQWSACSATCIPSSLEHFKYTGYDERGSAYQRYSKFIQITPKEPPPSMPKRNRYRTIFKKARFGGTCVEESFWSNIDDNEGLVWQNEDCKLCPEHCLTPNNTDILNYPLLKYPGDDAQCVGYCPMNCGWREEKCVEDCVSFKEEFFNDPLKLPEITDERQADFMKKYKCYFSFVLKVLAVNGMAREYNDFKDELSAVLTKSMEEHNDFELPWSVNEFKTLRPVMRSREDLHRSVKGQLSNGWNLDRDILVKFHQSINVKVAVVPNLDGFYGGKPCVRSSDEKILTIRGDNDPKFNPKKHHNQLPEDSHEFWDQCELVTLCDFQVDQKGRGSAFVEPPCTFFAWAEWGSWGKCNEHCGPNGKRKRFRDCINTCDNKKNDDSKCKPFFNNIQKRNYTSTDVTECTPCPASELPQWSQWGEWTRVGTDKLCGNGEFTMERKRSCAKAKDRALKCSTGNESEKMSMQKPPCKPTAEISVCVNCIDEEDKSNEGTERPGYKGEDIGGDENTETPEIQTPRLQGSGDDNNDADHDDDGPPIKMSMNSDSDEVAAGSGNTSDEEVQNGENFELPEISMSQDYYGTMD